jgi:hypothetical protein
LVVAATAVAVLAAQAPAQKPSFEVASIKPTKFDGMLSVASRDDGQSVCRDKHDAQRFMSKLLVGRHGLTKITLILKRRSKSILLEPGP